MKKIFNFYLLFKKEQPTFVTLKRKDMKTKKNIKHLITAVFLLCTTALYVYVVNSSSHPTDKTISKGLELYGVQLVSK